MDNLQQNNPIEQYKEIPFGSVQHNVAHIPATAAEINYLWLTYIAMSMAETFVKHALAQAEDRDYIKVLSASLDVSTIQLNSMKEVFQSINHPIPAAFGDKDVNVSSPRLIDETSTVRYIHMMNSYIIESHAVALGLSTRSDIRQLFSSFIDDSRNILQMAIDVLLAKGTHLKIPYINVPDKVEFVDDKDYYGSFLGNGRPLNALEITSIESILNFKVVLRIVKLAFAQVCNSDDIREFFTEGAKVADKHIKILRSIVEKDGLPVPELSDYRITDSKEFTFSDRMMLFHVVTIVGYILTEYGRGLSRIMRKDVATTYMRLLSEILVVAKDGADLLVKYRWLEKPPSMVNRQKLTH